MQQLSPIPLCQPFAEEAVGTCLKALPLSKILLCPLTMENTSIQQHAILNMLPHVMEEISAV